jgi:hypothetical protein
MGTGCFVFDEIDQGVALMEQHSSAPKTPKAAAGKAEDDGAFTMAALKKKGAGALKDLSGRVEEAMKKAPDPENTMIKCRLEGRVQFTRKFDCQSRGGKVDER